MAVDSEKLNEFLGKFVTDLGATAHAGMVVLGDRLGLYRTLADRAMTASELAARAKIDPRYAREWLSSQAAGGYVNYDPSGDTFSLSEEQSSVLARDDGPAYLPGAFELALGSLRIVPRLVDAFKSGDGIGWNEQDSDVFHGCEKFFRPGYAANLVSNWIPALTGVKEKLARGVKVADVGCGKGASTILMAQAFPKSYFIGFDYHAESIDAARASARKQGLDGRVKFEIAKAKEFPGSGYDFVTMFDCLHDMGDPVGAARHVHEALAADGTWMIVEPFAHNALQDNLNPVGRVYYSFSTMLCTPCSRSQEVGLCLGAQAGEERLHKVMAAGGFSRFRRATETPFNLVFEARP